MFNWGKSRAADIFPAKKRKCILIHSENENPSQYMKKRKHFFVYDYTGKNTTLSLFFFLYHDGLYYFYIKKKNILLYIGRTADEDTFSFESYM